MSSSKISVDLNNRTFDLEVEREDLADVIAMLSDLFSKHGGQPIKPSLGNTGNASDAGGTANPDAVEEKTGGKKRSRSKGSAKAKSYNIIDLGIGPNERAAMKADFESKSPKGQSNEVAVLGLALKNQLNKTTFSADEIHSAFKIVNKPTPKNLIAVFGNMKRDGLAGYENNELHVNSFTEDHVNFHMTSDSE